MKLHKQFWIWLLVFTPTFVVFYLLIDYIFPGNDGFLLKENLGSASFVGAFTAVLMYFNRYTLHGEPREKKRKERAGGNRN